MSAALAADRVGDYRDAETVLAFARDVDVVTFDHEHVPQDVLRALVDAGHPRAARARRPRDSRRTSSSCASACPSSGLPHARLGAASTTPAELDDFLADHGGRAVVKTPRGGYDGKGVRVVRAAAEVDDWFATLAEDGRGGALLVEELVDFRRELAQLVARRPSGEIARVARRRDRAARRRLRRGHRAGPALGRPAGGCRRRRRRSRSPRASASPGVLAVELFETTDERLLVNELAMRPHNSGHWTHGRRRRPSQFEQHLRAVLDLPLGDTGSHEAVVRHGQRPRRPGRGHPDRPLRRRRWRSIRP